MWERVKLWFRDRIRGTVFGDAYDAFGRMYERNRIACIIEVIVIFILGILITGNFRLAVMNTAGIISGRHYRYTLWNCFAAWFSLSGIILSIVFFVLLEMAIGRFIRIFRIRYRHDDERNIDVAEEGTYGSAHFMDKKTMHETFECGEIRENKSTIFGCDPDNTKIVVGQKHPLLKLNRNCLIIAGPSGGKSATFVIPMLFQMIRRGESAIVSDPKSELFAIVGEVAKKCGYEVRILNLNPMFLANSDPCNFLQYVGDDTDKAQVMSTTIIANTTNASESGDFWTEGATNLLQFVMLYINVGDTFPKSQKNLPYLFRWLVEHSLEEIDGIIENLPDNHVAKAPGNIFSGGEAKVKAQTLQGLRIKLKLLDSAALKNILSKTEGGIDLLNPGRKKCMYFVGSNDQEASMAPILALFYTLLYQELVRYADMREDRTLPVPVHMVLDEYANIGKIPDFEKKLSTVRSRGIVTYIIIQDMNQLKTKHPNDTYRTVINDCDYHIMLKTNDTETMKWWEEMSGTMTVNVKNRAYESDKSFAVNIHHNERISEGQGARGVVTSHEARTLKDDEVLVLVSQRNPIKLKTYFWKNHPYAKYVKEVLPVQHYPLWRLKEDGIVGEDFTVEDYDNPNIPTFVFELPKDEELVIDEDYNPDETLGVFEKKSSKSVKKRNAVNFIKNPKNEKKEETKEVVKVPEVMVVKPKQKEDPPKPATMPPEGEKNPDAGGPDAKPKASPESPKQPKADPPKKPTPPSPQGQAGTNPPQTHDGTKGYKNPKTPGKGNKSTNPAKENPDNLFAGLENVDDFD